VEAPVVALVIKIVCLCFVTTPIKTPGLIFSRFATIANHDPQDLPLAGVRVLELGQLIAGPFAGQLLG
jgi:hypothetical protein